MMRALARLATGIWWEDYRILRYRKSRAVPNVQCAMLQDVRASAACASGTIDRLYRLNWPDRAGNIRFRDDIPTTPHGGDYGWREAEKGQTRFKTRFPFYSYGRRRRNRRSGCLCFTRTACEQDVPKGGVVSADTKGQSAMCQLLEFRGSGIVQAGRWDNISVGLVRYIYHQKMISLPDRPRVNESDP
jgi:hypothetical protein